ncbi:MAG TPA: hypothetical protein VN974_04955 [Candidatus Dormibacteraeota bacterium]|nr:hypothetical protein [Candidatus Dormibacteraeota bacterium]
MPFTSRHLGPAPTGVDKYDAKDRMPTAHAATIPSARATPVPAASCHA